MLIQATVNKTAVANSLFFGCPCRCPWMLERLGRLGSIHVSIEKTGPWLFKGICWG